MNYSKKDKGLLVAASVVLIIEDEKEFGLILQESLAERKITADLVHTGREGLKALGTTSYKVLVSDVNLPDMLGTEIIQTAKNQNTLPASVLIMSAIVSQIEIERSKHNVVNIFEKPVDLDRLVTEIESLL